MKLINSGFFTGFNYRVPLYFGEWETSADKTVPSKNLVKDEH